MAKPKPKSARGVYEYPRESGVWWVNYYTNGRRHREKVGRKSDAIDLYHTRKADARAGRKLPDLRNSTAVTISDLIDLAIEFTASHKDKRSYISKGEIVRKHLGDRVAGEITPQDLDQWLSKHCKTPATANRYRAFLSLCYKLGMANGKVDKNPARLVRQRKEANSRLRFLSREEYDCLCAVIRSRYPKHLAEFVISVNTGMRLFEQYSITWGQVDLVRRAIRLTESKNGSARTVHLNTDAVTALESVRVSGQKTADKIFPREGVDFRTRKWFIPSLAEAGIQGYVWHSNRHTFCSWLAMAGATIKEIQELAGHKTISMSARYAHLSPDHKLGVIERISSTASKQPPEAQRQPTATKTATTKEKAISI